MEYVVFRGVYPFDEVLGIVNGPEDQPEVALKEAIKNFKELGVPSPVITPNNNTITKH